MKRRLSATIDESVLAAAERAVAQGRAPSVSALVEEALIQRQALDRRLNAGADLMDWMEEAWGAVDEAALAAARAESDARLIRVRREGRGTSVADAA